MSTAPSPELRWCAARLAGLPADAAHRPDAVALLALARREGVVGLLHAALVAAHDAEDRALGATLAGEARTAAARSLLCQAEARRVQQRLDEVGIPSIWLKGIALGQWLYSSAHLRDLADIDLLLPDHATALRAAAAIAPLGYFLPNPHIAGNLVVHELLAWSERSRLELDLHWDVCNAALFAGRMRWDRLWRISRPLPSIGSGARGLDDVDACLHASLHRAVNRLTGRQDRLRWLFDLHLLARRFDARGWQLCVENAIEAGLADALASALAAVQDLFASPVPPAALKALQDAAVREPIRTERLRNWTYFQWSCWRRLPDLRTRLRWLRQLLFPDLAHLQARYGEDGAGVVRLLGRRLGDGWRRWRGYLEP